MVGVLRKNYIIFSLILLFIGVNSYLIFNDNYLLNTLPFVLIIAYTVIFHIRTAFLLTVFLTPLSVNIEEFTTNQIGLFIPTEPILFGMMILIILIVLKEIKYSIIDKKFWMHPITITLFIYLVWMFITSITSTHTLVSFKFLLMKLWYIIPILTIGFIVFSKKSNIAKFLWCFSIGMTIVIAYTVIHHASYNFGEEEAYWVMFPFFKDHTIYGAIVAINTYFVLGLLGYKKHNLITQLLLIFMLVVTLVGLYFSYTRGAWLSVVFALCVWLCIKYKVKFKYLLTIGLVLTVIVLISWHKIEDEMAKNKTEHTATTFSGQLESSTNISSDASNLERINRWSAAINMFEERPVFGFGPATYAFEYAPYQDPSKLTVISTNFGDLGNAHSEYLGPLAEMGALGFLTVVAFVAALFYSGITLLINIKRYTPEDTQLYSLILFIVLALSTYFFHGLLNNYLDTDKASIPVYSAAAIFIAQQINMKKQLKAKAKEQNTIVQ